MNINLSENKIFLVLFFFPLTYLVGIAIAEIFLLLFLIYLALNIKNIEFLEKKIFFILLLFSIYIAINGSLQISDNLKISSIFHFRYLLLSTAICIFYQKNLSVINQKKFINIFFLLIIIVIFDSFYQFYLGENILGQKLHAYRVSSFFGDDLILGSFLIRLLPIILWYIFYFKNSINSSGLFNIIFFSLYFITIYISGERTAFALFVGQLILFIFLVPDLRKILSSSFVILLIFIMLHSFYNFGKTDITHRMFVKTYKQITNNDNNILDEKNDKQINKNFKFYLKSIKIFSNDHQGHLIVANDLFSKNLYFGVGPKGFRHFCRSVDYQPERGICSTHPHNILAQTLSELGLVGLLFYLIFLFFLIRCLLLRFTKNNKDTSDLNGLLVISIGLIVHFFPLLPSGNFFNNWISSFIYFKIGLLIYSYNKLLSK